MSEARATDGAVARTAAVRVRSHTDSDWPAVLAMLRATFAGGDTYAYPPDLSDEEIRRVWIEAPQGTFVAGIDDDGGERVVGTYTLKANQPGLGSHVANAGYVVAAEAQGRGIATAICVHSQAEARRLGHRAMQFNFLVSTNCCAIELRRRLDFATVATLPGAFQHARLGDVDAHVMFEALVE